MRIEALADADAVVRAGAAFTASEARTAVAARGRFIVAISGGRLSADDRSIPAGRTSRPQALVLADREAAASNASFGP
jgi:hypothetical protein